jgi:hypothetical protein
VIIFLGPCAYAEKVAWNCSHRIIRSPWQNKMKCNMKRVSKTIILSTVLAVLFTIALLGPSKNFAHCATMDGPVVKAAQRALEAGNVYFVLVYTLVRGTLPRAMIVAGWGHPAKTICCFILCLNHFTFLQQYLK